MTSTTTFLIRTSFRQINPITLLHTAYLVLAVMVINTSSLHAMLQGALDGPAHPIAPVVPAQAVFLPPAPPLALPAQQAAHAPQPFLAAPPAVLYPASQCFFQTAPPIPYAEVVRRVAHLCDATARGALPGLFNLLADPISRSLVPPHSWQLLKNCIDRDDVTMAHYLFCAGASPHERDPITTQSCVAYAAQTNHDAPRMLQLLRYAGAAPFYIRWPNGFASLDRWHLELLHTTIETGKLHKAEELLAIGLPIDGQPMQTSTPLVTAIVNRNSVAVDYLLSRGANPNRQNPINGDTPLALLARLANRQRSVEIAKMLLSHPGISLFLLNREGKTAYSNALENSKRRTGTSKMSLRKQRAAAAVLQAIQKSILAVARDVGQSGLHSDIIFGCIMPFLGVNLPPGATRQ